MKKIKVKQIFGGHQIYQEMVNYPPKDVEYVGVSTETQEGKYYESKKLKEKLGTMLQKLKLPRMMIIKPGDYDLIHSSRGIIPLQLWNKKPWVIDMEHVHSFFGLDPKLIKNKFWKRFIEKKLASKYCKGILCHCEATRQAFFKNLNCSKFGDKIKVLYPASHIVPIKREKHKKIRILCVLSLFKPKGGPQVLEAFSRLEKKYKDIELWLRSDVPESFKKKYNSKNIKYMDYFGDIIPREKLLKEIYSKCDIFLYPTFCDTFGYSLIDAMIAKLPIVGTSLYAIPEIVEEGENGFIIKIEGYSVESGITEHLTKGLPQDGGGKFINGMIERLERLIKNKKLREEMGQKGFEMVNKGKFSIEERNKQLREIYGGSLEENENR